MNIEDEWENFFATDNLKEEIVSVKPVAMLECDVPKCSPIYISTKTNIAYFNTNIDLVDVFWNIKMTDYCDDRDGIIKKQMKFNSTSSDEQDLVDVMYQKENVFKTHDITTHIDTLTLKKGVYKDVRKITIGISNKDIQSFRTKKKSAFYNCFVVILRLFDIERDSFKEVHIKVFNTGKIEVPGIQDDEMFYRSVEYMRNILREYYPKINYSKEAVETVLINSNFSCGYIVNREKLYDLLVNRYKIPSLYDPCSYPGVQSKYTITEVDRIIELSFMIFRTGSVLIVGKCEKEHIVIVYEFLKEFFTSEYNNINQDNTRIDVETTKVKKQPKQRKKTINRLVVK